MLHVIKFYNSTNEILKLVLNCSGETGVEHFLAAKAF